MRSLNYVFSSASLVVGIALVLIVLSQAEEFRLRTLVWPPDWSMGTVIGALLIINGAVRLWFAQDDTDADGQEGIEHI